MIRPTDPDLDGPDLDGPNHRPERRGPHWPTVLVSTCAAVVVGAAIPTSVLIGMHFGEGEREIVVRMEASDESVGSLQTPAGGVTVLDPQVPDAAAMTPAPAAGPAAATGAPAAAAASTPAAAAVSAPRAAGTASASTGAAEAPAGPSTPDLATLDAQLKRGLDSATNEAEIAASIEGGAAGVPTVRSVGNALDLAAAIYRWNLEGPVTVTGDVARAQLTTSLIGGEPGRATLKWYWMDGQWKLSNDSLCFLAHRAMTACTVPGDPGGANGHPL